MIRASRLHVSATSLTLFAAAAASAAMTVACDRLPGIGAKSETSEAPASAPVTNGTAAAGNGPSQGSSGGTAKPGAAPPAAAAGSNVVGMAGVTAWDALGAADKQKIKATSAIYIHQSVGQDLEDGAEEIGFKFGYYGPNADSVDPGLNGGLFNDVGPIDNGKPMEKLALVQKVAKRHAGKLKVMSFSFGYADVRDDDLAKVEAQYVEVAKAVRATGAKMLHVTPPLVFDTNENGAKMKMRTWMLQTFASDTIFDLQDIESLDGGKRCEAGGVWRICQANRSSSACPSKGQGVDNDGQGHLCSKKAAVFAKALLYAVYRASI